MPDIITKHLLAVDIGNSRAKALHGDSVFAEEYNDGWAVRFAETVANVNAGIVGISSVNSERLKELLDSLAKFSNIRIIFADELLSKQNILRYDNIEGIGSDRLFGMIGALSLFKPPVITIDCGTAITINAVNFNSQCVGGAIFPGIRTQLTALAKSAEALEEVELFYTGSPLGINTEDALRAGIVTGAVGSINYLTERIIIEKFNNIATKIVLTGGFAYLLYNVLKDWRTESIVYRPNLVCYGIMETLSKFR